MNAPSTGGQTPLHLAAVFPGSTPTLEILLLQPGLKAMSKNCQDDSPFDIAARNRNSTEIFDLVRPAFTLQNETS